MRSQRELPELHDRRLLRQRVLCTGRMVRLFGYDARLPLRQ
jgi:hypothetical protein